MYGGSSSVYGNINYDKDTCTPGYMYTCTNVDVPIKHVCQLLVLYNIITVLPKIRFPLMIVCIYNFFLTHSSLKLLTQ